MLLQLLLLYTTVVTIYFIFVLYGRFPKKNKLAVLRALPTESKQLHMA